MNHEKRLIGRTLSDFNDPVKYNSRNAQQQAIDQTNQNRGTQLGSNPNADLVERMVQTNFDPSRATPQEIARHNEGMRLAETNTTAAPGYNPAKGVTGLADTVYGAKPGEQTVYQNPNNGTVGQAVNIPDGNIALNAFNRLTGDNNVGVSMSQTDAAKKLNDPSYKQGIQQASNTYGTAESAANDAETAVMEHYKAATASGAPIDFIKRDADIAAARMAATDNFTATEKAKEAEQKNVDKRAASSEASTAKTGETQKPPTLDDAALLASVGAAMEGLPGGDLIMQGLQASLQDAAAAKADAQKIHDNSVNQAKQSDLDTQNHIDKFAERYKENRDSSKKLAKDIRDETDKLLAENQIRDQEKLEWQSQMATQKAEKMKTDEVTKMSIALALGGGFGSRAGLDQVASAESEWNKSILNLQKEYAFKKADVGAFYTEKYVEAQQKYRSDLGAASKEYDSSLDALEQQGFASSQARKLAETNADNALILNLATVRKEHAATVKGYVSDVYAEINRNRDDQRAQEQIGWTRLENVMKTYGSFAPQSLLDSIAKQLPGVNVSDVAKQMTLAEMKQFKIKNGGGSGAAGSYGSDSSTQATNPLYAGVTTSDLKGAIQRIFNPTTYGGTASERAGKINEYMGRIASGEDPTNIAADLQGDYWASQKGAPRTAHDARTITQGSAEALQSYANFLGITAEADGSLGQIDSRVEWFKSFYGGSSDEYNNLSNEVNAIRAKMVKENYGTAVSPQELSLARSYIPEMTDKGNVFLTKVANLKTYNAYLDGKIFAANAGLPSPKPPTPVTMTGNAVAGPGKYSIDDITSALSK